MFDKFKDLVGMMSGAVGDLTGSQNEEADSHGGSLIKSFSETIAAIPEMFASLKQSFTGSGDNEDASIMTSIMANFDMPTILAMVTS